MKHYITPTKTLENSTGRLTAFAPFDGTIRSVEGDAGPENWDNNLYAFGGSDKGKAVISSIKNKARSTTTKPLVLAGAVILIGAIVFVIKRRTR